MQIENQVFMHWYFLVIFSALFGAGTTLILLTKKITLLMSLFLCVVMIIFSTYNLIRTYDKVLEKEKNERRKQ